MNWEKEKQSQKRKAQKEQNHFPLFENQEAEKSSSKNSSEYSANNNNRPGSRSSSEEITGKKSIKRAFSDGVENLELITAESIQRKKKELKKKIQNKSTRLLAREKRNEELTILKKQLKLAKVGKSPTQKTMKGKHFTSPASITKKSVGITRRKTPSPPRDYRESPRRSGRKR